MSRNGTGGQSAEIDALVNALHPHWRTDHHSENRPVVGYVRWVGCRCGWQSPSSKTAVNAPDLHRIWNGHVVDVLTSVIPPRLSDAGDPSCH